MQFTPRSEEECQQAGLLAAGNYGFEVAEAVNKRSANGNDMIELKVLVFPNDPDSAPRVTFDYLLEKMAFKLRHFCQHTGLIDQYQQGILTAQDCAGRTGFCSIGIQEDKSGRYGPKNFIRDYGQPKAEKAPLTDRPGNPTPPKPQAATNGKDMAEDDIPF